MAAHSGGARGQAVFDGCCTSARAGRIRGLSRWGLICPPFPTCGFNVHNKDSREAQPSSPTVPNKDERRLLHQKCSLIGGKLRRDPSLTFRVCLMARDGKVKFQVSGVELHSRDAAEESFFMHFTRLFTGNNSAAESLKRVPPLEFSPGIDPENKKGKIINECLMEKLPAA